jgi:hypothetical protein
MQARVGAEQELRDRAVGVGDSREQYPVAEILDVRVVVGKGRWASRVQALVRWEGEEWVGADSWEPAWALTSDMRKQVLADAAVSYPEAERRPAKLSRVARRRLVRQALIGGRLARVGGDLVAGTLMVVEGVSDDDRTERKRSARVLVEAGERRRKRRKVGPLRLGTPYGDSTEDSD